MMSPKKNYCIICCESGYNLKKICKICNNTYAHKKCYSALKSNDITKCPTCRRQFKPIRKINRIRIRQVNQININFPNVNWNFYKRNFFSYFEKLLIVIMNILKFITIAFCYLIALFLFYLLGGFVGAFFIMIFTNDNFTTDFYHILFPLQFLLGVIILFISFCCWACCSCLNSNNSVLPY